MVAWSMVREGETLCPPDYKVECSNSMQTQVLKHIGHFGVKEWDSPYRTKLLEEKLEKSMLDYNSSWHYNYKNVGL